MQNTKRCKHVPYKRKLMQTNWFEEVANGNKTDIVQRVVSDWAVTELFSLCRGLRRSPKVCQSLHTERMQPISINVDDVLRPVDPY